MSILLLDGCDDRRRLLKRLLEDAGESVRVIAALAEAAPPSGERSPARGLILDADVLLTAEGETTVVALRERQPDFPVIALESTLATQAGDEQQLQQALESYCAGADDYIRYPFHPDALIHRLRAILRRCESATEPK